MTEDNLFPSPRQTSKLSDVARRASVSTATVSRYLNDPERVAPATRARIEQAIADLHWIPSGAAKALATMRSRTVGTLVPFVGHQGIAKMLEALQAGLSRRNVTLLLGQPGESPETAVRQVSKMIERGIDALVLFGDTHPPQLLEMAERYGILVIFTYTSGGKDRRIRIGFDTAAAMRDVARHLLALGHRRFGMIAHGLEHNDRIRQRVDGFKEALAEEGIAIRPQHFALTESHTIGSGRKGAAMLLGGGDPPTAIVCATDYQAMGAVLEAARRGIAVPGDVSIIGFDDLELAAEMQPSLTTVRVPAQAIGEEVAHFIADALDTGTVGASPEALATSLVVRESSGPAPV